MHKVKKQCQFCKFYRKKSYSFFCFCWYSPLQGEETYKDETCESWSFGTKHKINKKKNKRKSDTLEKNKSNL